MKKLIQNIFSIRNKEMHKVITILGLRIAFKTKKTEKTYVQSMSMLIT